MKKIITLAIVTLLAAIALSSPIAAAPGHSFKARLDGSQEVPPVATDASGIVTFALNKNHTRIAFKLNVFNIEDVFAAHIHCGTVGANGGVGVTLFSGGSFSGNGSLAHGQIVEPDSGNACGWSNVADIVAAMQSGDTYVNVHTLSNPGGEIRGQLQ